MEIKIGVINIPREVTLESDQPVKEVELAVRTALKDNDLLSLTDTKGRTVLVPADKVGYVELGQPNARPVGFGQL